MTLNLKNMDIEEIVLTEDTLCKSGGGLIKKGSKAIKCNDKYLEGVYRSLGSLEAYMDYAEIDLIGLPEGEDPIVEKIRKIFEKEKRKNN